MISNGLDLPIVSNDDGQREAEADDLLIIVGAEGPDSSDGQLVDRGHPLLVAVTRILLALAAELLELCKRNFESRE